MTWLTSWIYEQGPRAVLEIILGLVYGNAFEWLVHRYVLHGMGKNKSSLWAFHWHDHHKKARRGLMVDEDYQVGIKGMNAPAKEVISLFGAAVLHLPLLWVAPFFTLTAWYGAFNYYRVHKKAHLDIEWGKKHLSWHYDHHMGPNQDANWCVTRPYFDWLMGTRKKYAGSELERQHQARERVKLQARQRLSREHPI